MMIDKALKMELNQSIMQATLQTINYKCKMQVSDSRILVSYY